MSSEDDRDSGEEEVMSDQSENEEEGESGGDDGEEDSDAGEGAEEELDNEEEEGESGGDDEEDDSEGGEGVEEELDNEEDEQGDHGDEEGDEEGLSGWADSMSKILKSTKPKNKKNLILSRAKKDYEVDKTPKPKVKHEIEIAKDDKSAVKKEENEETKDSDELSVKQQRKLELKQRKLERAWENLNRITTSNPDQEFEVNLMKIATKGVVQLFNAVAQQQKTVKSKLKANSKSEFKKDKVLSQSKDIFDKAMKKNKIVGGTSEDPDIKEESSSDEDQPTNQGKRKIISLSCDAPSGKKRMWSALQDDFMLDAKLKDWDKESDSD